MAESKRLGIFLQKLAQHKWLLPAAMFVLGVFVGAASILFAQAQGGSFSRRDASTSSNRSPEERATRRVERSYQHAKDRVQRDTESGRLTKQQAKLLDAKLQEVYKQQQGLRANPAERQKTLIQKRKELREWAKSNNISNMYFNWVY